MRMVPPEQLLEARAAADRRPNALKAALDRLWQKPFFDDFYGRICVGGHRIASEACRIPECSCLANCDILANIASAAKRGATSATIFTQ